MPSRLKSLELTGYKTFATKTQFIFGERITAVVGPNGSGKSNIADSIRWVLGEQSFSLLRGRKTEDMIFAGSELRARANVAQAVVTFDNSDGWLPIDYAEVSIARRAYRDGQNEYLLNGQRTRLRDIAELLGKVGLAERTYTIVGQGLVDSALSLRAEERRALFEEAAGIGIYRGKREDALRKLEQTQHNLERVHDILAEIKPRLKTLERQAQRARDYNQVKAELDGVLKIWYGYHWHEAQKNLASARQAAEAQAGLLESIRGEQHSLDRSLADLRGRITALRSQLNHWQAESSKLRAQAETLNRNLAVADERLRAFAGQRDSMISDLHSLESDYAAQHDQLVLARAELDRMLVERDAARARLESLERIRAARETERRRMADQEAEAKGRAAAAAAQINERAARRAGLALERERLTTAIDEHTRGLAEAQALAGEQRTALDEREAAVQATLARLAGADAELQRIADGIARTEADLAGANARLADAIAAEGKLAARADVLAQTRIGLNDDSAIAALRQAARNSLLVVRAELADLITVPPELDTAITAALGQLLNAVVLDNPASALDLLADVEGRAALLPLGELRPAPLSLPDSPNPHPAVLGLASQLVSCDPAHRPIVDALLGRAIIVRDRGAAQLVASRLAPGAAAVTLNGEIFFSNGVIVGGRDTAASTFALAREQRALPAEIGQAKAARLTLETERAQLEAALQQLRGQRDAAADSRRGLQTAEREAAAARDSARLGLERAEAQAGLRRDQISGLQSQISQTHSIEETLAAEIGALTAEAAEAEAAARALAGQSLELTAGELAERIGEWQTQAAVAARAMLDAETRADEMRAALDRAAAVIEGRRSRIEALAAESETFVAALVQDRARLESLNTQIAELNELVEPAHRNLLNCESELAVVETAETEIRAGLHAAERTHADLQLDYARKKDEIEALRRQITDDFGLVALEYTDDMPGPTPLPLDGVVEHLPLVETLPDGLEDLLNRRRGQLKRMGAINPEALNEFNEVKERHDFLVTQVADLESAAAQLREVIVELDALMEREFRRTFDAVAERFKDTFSRLFGGGTARLILTEPENFTQTGIDIIARLPGRKQQGLALLSGGERALTASALLFALLQVNPPPFAMLDEVDAALDEANVGRFRDLLLELSQTTQFVIITHNRSTVQAADTVYGISMGADSASQAISLKLDGEKVAQN